MTISFSYESVYRTLHLIEMTG